MTHGFADGYALFAKFYNPWDIILDSNGDILVSDYSNNRIRKLIMNAGEFIFFYLVFSMFSLS